MVARAKIILEALSHARAISLADFDLQDKEEQLAKYHETIDGIPFNFFLSYYPKEKELNFYFSRGMFTREQVQTDPRTALKVFKVARDFLIPNADILWKNDGLSSITFEADATEQSRVKFYYKAAQEIAKRYNGRALPPRTPNKYVLFKILVGATPS